MISFKRQMVFVGVGTLGVISISICICICILIGQHFRHPRPIADEVATAASKGRITKVLTREEFKKLVAGKTMAEVLSLLGRPYDTDPSLFGDERETWRYLGVSMDPISGRNDRSATVWFEDGKVVRVSF